jgi:hypothetical protein
MSVLLNLWSPWSVRLTKERLKLVVSLSVCNSLCALCQIMWIFNQTPLVLIFNMWSQVQAWTDSAVRCFIVHCWLCFLQQNSVLNICLAEHCLGCVRVSFSLSMLGFVYFAILLFQQGLFCRSWYDVSVDCQAQHCNCCSVNVVWSCWYVFTDPQSATTGYDLRGNCQTVLMLRGKKPYSYSH